MVDGEEDFPLSSGPPFREIKIEYLSFSPPLLFFFSSSIPELSAPSPLSQEESQALFSPSPRTKRERTTHAGVLSPFLPPHLVFPSLLRRSRLLRIRLEGAVKTQPFPLFLSASSTPLSPLFSRAFIWPSRRASPPRAEAKDSGAFPLVFSLHPPFPPFFFFSWYQAIPSF